MNFFKIVLFTLVVSFSAKAQNGGLGCSLFALATEYVNDFEEILKPRQEAGLIELIVKHEKKTAN